MWIEWLKYTYRGRMWTRSQGIGWFVFQLSRTPPSISDPAHICWWQFMHVLVGGMPAKADVSTDVWQYRQSIPSSPTWCLWLNGTGWSTISFCPVRYPDR